MITIFCSKNWGFEVKKNNSAHLRIMIILFESNVYGEKKEWRGTSPSIQKGWLFDFLGIVSLVIPQKTTAPVREHKAFLIPCPPLSSRSANL